MNSATIQKKENVPAEVLILAPAFPPDGESGVHRTLKFVKHLTNFGWRSIVVSPSAQAFPFLDRDLEKEIPKEAVVYRTGFPTLGRIVRNWMDVSTPFPSVPFSRRPQFSLKGLLRRMNIFVIPDIYITWLPYAVPASLRAVRRHRPAAFLVSAPPPSVAVIGAIVSRLASLPLIVDFRDGWTVEPYYGARYGRASPRAWFEKILESLVFRCADRILCQQAVMARDYAQKYPQHRSKISVLNNGFDEEDFTRVQPYAFSRPTVLHTGYLDYRRNPGGFFEALTILQKKRPDLTRELQVLFVGRTQVDYPRLVDEMNLQRLVQFQDHVSHRTAVSMMAGASGLLLLTGGDESELPGKLFEYIGARRPIFALAHPKGQSAQILESAKAGVVVAGASPETIAAGLENFLDKLTFGDWIPDGVNLYPFTRRHATEQLAQVLHEVSRSRGLPQLRMA